MILLLAAALFFLSPARSSVSGFDSPARSSVSGFDSPARWQTLDHNLAPFTERFNGYSDRYRLVMLVSPT
jgi:hypothetical protein